MSGPKEEIKSPFRTPAKNSNGPLDPNESIISPRFMRPAATPRKQTKKSLEIFDPNCSSIEPDGAVSSGALFETPKRSSTPSLLLSQFNQNQAVVTDKFLNCRMNQQTRILRTVPKGRTYYTTVPMISSFSPNSSHKHSAIFDKPEVKSHFREELGLEQKLLMEIEANRKIIQELQERIMKDKKDACTCINESFLPDERDALSESIREFAEAHPLEERFAPIFFFLLLLYVLHLVTEPLFNNGSWKHLYLLMVRMAHFLRVNIVSKFDFDFF